MSISKMKIWNTKKGGTLEFLVYGQGTSYIGVCLTLDIVEEGNDPKNLMESIVESATGHVKLVQSKNLNDALLNRPAPQEYWDVYNKILGELQKKTQTDGFIYTMPIDTLIHA